MKTEVWDTYVKQTDGSVAHFDVVIQRGAKHSSEVYRYAQEYLAGKGIKDADIDASACRFCHIENPTDETVADIEKKGYHIIEMDTIPAAMPTDPQRRDYILHLRAHYPEHRFGNMQGKSLEDLKEMAGRKP